jgi:hypothetical protein
MSGMNVGIGLPAAVPKTDMTLLGRWAEEAERGGFESVGVIDRLVYDNLDPLTALAVAAALTTPDQLRAELWRRSEAGCTDVLLYPCSGDLDQVTLLMEAMQT